MLYRTLADAVLVIHLLFILFVVGGGFLVLRWPKIAWAHLPVALWGAVIELAGWICPLTPLENAWRHAAGDAGYGGGFIEHYLLPAIYPAQLTSAIQTGLGLAVVVINLLIYTWVWRRKRSG
ncbi:MAG: DUF2784 domain-containing protein [Burkholderiales bacterium]|nr:DUF2784 domain-containing protein [Burkholderiales bacterium]